MKIPNKLIRIFIIDEWSTGADFIFQNVSPSRLIKGKINLKDKVEISNKLNRNTDKYIPVCK
jgi:hypothetical protein